MPLHLFTNSLVVKVFLSQVSAFTRKSKETMVTGESVSRRASAGVPSTSMVGVGPSTTLLTAAEVGLSPCNVTRV